VAQEDTDSAKVELAQLADVYDQHPETRFTIGVFLSSTAYGRLNPVALGGTNNGSMKTDVALVPFQAIVPTLLNHLFDGEARDNPRHISANESIMQLFYYLAFPQNPSGNILLQPLIDLYRTETKPSGALGVVAEFCGRSQQAAMTLIEAAAVDQPVEKRAAALHAIGEVLSPSSVAFCKNPDLIDPVLQGLKSNQQTIVREAIHAAEAFVSQKPSPDVFAPLKTELEGLAANQEDTLTAQNAKQALQQWQLWRSQ
jgi:hypothetical protein